MAYNVLTGSGIKSLNRYNTGTLPSGASTTTVAITEVSSLSKTSVNLLSTFGDNQGNNIVSLELTSTTEVSVHYNLTDGMLAIYFEVIEVY
jgi:hypothetical protein